jgi:hypothetical protein
MIIYDAIDLLYILLYFIQDIGRYEREGLLGS